MKRRLPVVSICLVLVFAGYAAWRTEMTRSVTVPLEGTGYDLIYTVAWGWGMEEKFSLTRAESVMSGLSSRWIEIWKKPYNAGMALYRSQDGATYYLGMSFNIFLFDSASGILDVFCDRKRHVERFPEAIAGHGGGEFVDGAPRLQRYVYERLQPRIPSAPPESKFYVNLKYLGKFGVTNSKGWRGDGVSFVPADDTSEPRNGLDGRCG
jgi:hypothetical protein